MQSETGQGMGRPLANTGITQDTLSLYRYLANVQHHPDQQAIKAGNNCKQQWQRAPKESNAPERMNTTYNNLKTNVCSIYPSSGAAAVHWHALTQL
jgi:hypothetical protein